MSEHGDDAIESVVPIFPLPNAVLFPHTVLPLHVFEPRYREMVEEATRGSGCIAIALLQPGYEENYEGSPEIHRVGTVGRIEDLRKTDDGRYHLNLTGLRRADLYEIPSGRPFRLARVAPRPEPTVDESDPRLQRAKVDLLASQGYLMREIAAEPPPSIILDERMSFVAAVNGACANLPVDAAVRQQLLEVDDPIARHDRVQRLINELLQHVLAQKTSTPDDPVN
jgi:Lon protease-like protein